MLHVVSSNTKFLDAKMLANANDLAHWHEKQGRHGTATLISTLVAEVEALREAGKGALVIVQQASAATDLANLKATVLLIVAEKLLPVIAAEVERRQQGGGAQTWATLARLSNELHAAIKLAKG